MWRKLGLMTLLSMSGYLYAADIALTMRAEKRPTENCSLFDDSEVLSIFELLVGACALRG